MNTFEVDNVTIVIRSVGERTKAACYHLLAQQIPMQNIVVVQESPFTAAIARTFEIGLERGLPWTLCIDADVLVRPEAVIELLSIAQQTDENVFEIQGNVLDKFFCMLRPAGNHLYRTNLLAEGLKHIPAEGVSLRPETYLLRQMAAQGYPWIQEDLAVGLHDYEQYYRDVYRKAFLHAAKHGRYIPYLATLWERLAGKDADYQVALWGLYAGLITDESVTVDSRLFSQKNVDALLQNRGWQEKSALAATAWVASKGGQVIESFIPPGEYRVYQQLQEASSLIVWQGQLNVLHKKIGWLKTASWLLKKGWRSLTKPSLTYSEPSINCAGKNLQI